VSSRLYFFLFTSIDITQASYFHATLFADDDYLRMSNTCFDVLQTTVNLELRKFHNWLKANKLSPNSNNSIFFLINKFVIKTQSCCI